MLFEPRRITLKDGRKALLRNPLPEQDAAALVACLRQICGETEFLLRYPEECDWTEEKERDILTEIVASEHRLMLVCEAEGGIVGMCGLNLHPQIKFRHRADVDLSLLRRFWDLGIGTAMLNALIRKAREKGVLQMELEYIDGNARARALYEKLGFEQFAVHPDAIRMKDGRMVDTICMVKKL